MISQSAQGLQQSLNNLSSYCKMWKLKINVSKSKHMIISKRKLKRYAEANFENVPLELVHNFLYLGININSNGSFTQCKEILTKKAQKSINKLKGLLCGMTVKKSVALKLFDQLVLPILTYGAEIWAPLDMKNLLVKGNTCIEELYSKLPQEKLNIQFCKFILRVSSRSSNLAAMGELGRYPLYVYILPRVIKYYSRITEIQDNSLLKDAFSEMIKADETNSRKSVTWFKIMKHIINSIKVNNCKDKKVVKQELQKRYRTFWENLIQNQSGKLDTFKEIKQDFMYEKYLDFGAKQHQTELTKLRISNHKLNIETGRYKKPFIPRENRLCDMCNDRVEDEAHFMFECPSLKEIRKNSFGSEFIGGDKYQTLRAYIGDFTNSDPVSVGKYIKRAMEKRDS